MKQILLLILTIISFILLIISKEINIFLAFFLLFIPLIIDYFIHQREGIEIIKYNKVIIFFYLIITVISYFLTNNLITSSLILLQLLLYYFYNPKLSIQEEYIYVDTIILKNNIKPSRSIKEKYNKAGINLINKTTNNSSSLIARSNTELTELYYKIENNRQKYENLVRGKKIQLITSFVIPFVLVFTFIFKLPNPLNNINLFIINFLFSLNNIYLVVLLPSEKDIMTRKPRKKNEQLFSSEEKLFIYVNIFCYIAAITIPYMLILYNSNDLNLNNYVFLLSLIITNIINIAYNLNDSPTIINIFKYLINKIYITIIIISIIIITLIHFIYSRYSSFGIINTIKLLIIIIIIIGWQDIIKLARYLKIRKKDKNDRNYQ